MPVTLADGEAFGDERHYPVPASDGVTIDRSAQVILVRYANRVFAMALACPHEHASVKWLPADGRFQCTKHDSKYTPDGVYTSGRATRNLDRFPVRRDGTAIVVAVDRVFQSDKDLAGWKGAVIDLST